MRGESFYLAAPELFCFAAKLGYLAPVHDGDFRPLTDWAHSAISTFGR